MCIFFCMDGLGIGERYMYLILPAWFGVALLNPPNRNNSLLTLQL